MAKKTKKQAKKAEHKVVEHRRPSWLKWAVLAAVVVLLGAAGFAAWFYQDRALPNVKVGVIAVGQMSREQIRQTIMQQEEALKVTFLNGEKKATVLAKDIGVVVDVENTLKQALTARRSNNVGQNIALWQPEIIPLSFHNDVGQLKAYIQQHFPEVFVDAKDAALVYNEATGQFDIQPGVPGKGFDIKAFESELPNLARQPRAVTMAVSTVPVEPIIQAKALEETQKAINSQIKLPLQFLLNGHVFYSVAPGEIAKWIHFVPNPTNGTVKTEYDKAKIQQFVSQQVTPRVAQPPIERKVIVDKQTGAQTVLQQGRVGRQIQNVEDVSNEVVGALQGNKPLSKEVAIVEAPFKTVTMSSHAKWIEIDLSQQRLTLYNGDTALQSFVVSTGKANTPTRIGEFRVWLKRSSQTMTGTIAGEYYYLPNVKWVSYFDGEEAIHGTYWHNNFGRPMSHGCVNMTEAAAKIVYDFAPIGTKVVVHA